MFALVDVNTFYASCEKIFRPDLKNEPVIVLSNNDGCVIARSPESKILGIKMGQPWFQIKTQHFPRRIHAFSSNYSLYHDISVRVSTVLEEMAPATEIYSIDESFLDITGIGRAEPFEDYGRRVRERVRAVTGLTVGVGMGPTKTLAKSAQWASKEWPQFGGVLALTPDNPVRTQKLLARQPVEEVWGVGRRLSKKLNAMGIVTALDLARSNVAFIRKNFSVVLERTVRELSGEPCIALEEASPTKQQIVCSRSFGDRVTTIDGLRQALCRHAERAAEKLRQEGQYCRHISAFIKTSPFSPGEPYYGNVAGQRLTVATQDTRDIIAVAMKSLEHIWRDGHRYAKAGVMLGDFSPAATAQLSFFDDHPPRPASAQLMAVMDKVNNSGLGKLWFAGRGIAPEWEMKREMLSPAWTTRWNDIPVARLL
ncbi:translesion error-prone DNA polymerase V subunit UmuC [Erwinia mallotivora]|uniref:translesion error-prone DNA polymerase V subunit UmuC n=1 Tax=Erwinia mallotivora TaxID=69222 RepID=UPI0021C205AC|nr:translesion error-prone DNA polymerase V subunit UmuC [Erwinia mallotivora]